MNEALEKGGVGFIFSLLFFATAMMVLWFLYPKLMERAGKEQAAGYWKAEREANEKRLFGGTGD